MSACKAVNSKLDLGALFLGSLGVVHIWLWVNHLSVGLSRDILLIYDMMLILGLVIFFKRDVLEGYFHLQINRKGARFLADENGAVLPYYLGLVACIMLFSLGLLLTGHLSGQLAVRIDGELAVPTVVEQAFVAVPVETLVFQTLMPAALASHLVGKYGRRNPNYLYLAAVAMTQIVFAAMHYPRYPPEMLVGMFGLGIVWTLIVEYYGFMMGAYSHFMWNMFSFHVIHF